MVSGKEDLFTHYGLNEEIASISDRVVPLPGGGSLVFDYTEAMTVIDVNSGHYSTGSDREETSLATNREAALEIARQLRLRDIGGIIVADFIDMERKEEQEEILDLLRREFAMDRMKPRVMGMTALNLVEMTRMKARRNLFGTVYTTCPMCQGSGRVESPETVYVESGAAAQPLSRSCHGPQFGPFCSPSGRGMDSHPWDERHGTGIWCQDSLGFQSIIGRGCLYAPQCP